jgi:cupin fold WbuC family metalloprotein
VTTVLPRVIDRELLARVSASAAAAPRRRKNHDFHASSEEPANRLLNAVEPDSYVVPHRHLDATKDETIVVVAGRFGFVFFDDDGRVVSLVDAAPGGDVVGVTIPHGCWHSVVALSPASVFFESKSGPYRALTADERAPWAPAENDPDAPAYRQRLTALFTPTPARR